MTKPTILYYECMNWETSILDKMIENFHLVVRKDPTWDHSLTPAELEDIVAVGAPAGYTFNNQHLAKFPNIRYLYTNMTAPTHIELDTLGISVLSLDGAECLESITSTAEHTMGLIHAVHRSIPAAHTMCTDRDEWDRWMWAAPSMLSKMTLGIIGRGRLGYMVGERAWPMFETVTSCDRGEDLDTILSISDIITLHITPHPDDHQPVIGYEQIEKMKPGSILINTSRPEVLDHSALLHFLNQGHLRGAALDCLPGEHRHHMPTLSQRLKTYAASHSNLIITPHIGGSTEDAYLMTQGAVLDKLLSEIKSD